MNPSCGRAVSYTHLAVYKRQAHVALQQFFYGICLTQCHLVQAHIPVSYTHLDVYKRQAFFFFKVLHLYARPLLTKAMDGRNA